MRLLLCLTGFALFVACGDAPAEPLDPIANRARLFYYDIYDVASRAVRVPYELAAPIVVRTAVRTWVRGLPLEAEVRRRVLDRVDSPDLLDEVVPFLLALKETYVAGAGDIEPFEEWVRRTYSPDEAIPGMEHSLFSWNREPDAADAGTGFALDPDLTARVLTLYDALYLADAESDPGLAEGLQSCSRTERRASLRAAVERSQPVVRGIVEEVQPRIELGEEVDAAIQATLEDPKRLETVTTTAIEFIDHLVCSSYRVFATRIFREEHLRRWMLAELDEPDGGELFRYLAFANGERRYAALVVVDGLQGGLMEALVRGDGDDPFFRAVLAQQRKARGLAPPTQPSSPAPGVQTHFLDRLAQRPFTDPRYLPFFRDVYDDAGPGDPRRPYAVAERGVATTPTISVRNLPMAKTGAAVGGTGGTGIPNFHFVDRTFERPGEASDEASGRPYYFFGNDAMRLGPLTREAGMRSLFDRLPHLSSFSCAAQYDDLAHYRIDALVNLALGEGLRDFAETLCMTELGERARNERRLQGLRARLLKKRGDLVREVPLWRVLSVLAQRDERELAVRTIGEIARLEQHTLPELLVYYNPWPDHFAHFKGPFGDEILAPSGELSRLDYWLGVLTGVYRDANVEGRTLFALAGDHGLAPVFHLLNPEVLVFDALRAEGVDFRLAKISSDEGEGPKLNSLFEPPAMRGFDVVVASTAGGNYMLDFFVDQGPGWQRQPLYQDLLALRLIPKRGEQDRKVVDVLAEILARLNESLDYLVVRESACGVAGGEVRVIGTRAASGGEERADGWITRKGDRIFYRYEGADLLDTDRLTIYEPLSPGQRKAHARLRARCLDEAKPDVPDTWCREEEWRLLTSYTTRPDSVVQLAHVYDVDRAGTVNLFPREGIAYNSRVPGRHAGEFFHEKDALVGVWGAPVSRGSESGRIRTMVNGSLPGVVYEYLTGDRVIPGQDGWGFPSVAREIFP